MRNLRRTPPLLALAGVLVLGAACGDDAEAPVAAVGDATPDGSAPSEVDPADVAAYQGAVQRTIDAPSLTSTARVQVQTGSGVAEVALQSRRTPEGVVLTVTTDQGTLTYEVTAEGATLDRGDGPEPVDLAEVPRTPSLAALLEVEDLAFPEPGVATGTLPGSELATDLSPEASSVDVVVDYDADGLVTRLELRGPDDNYVAIVTYRTA